MRVITGSARGRRLKEIEGLETRPTTDRVKEALFSVIQFDIEGRRVLDLFAGTGQLGIEALSGDAMSYLKSGEKFDLIFLDPPYASGLLEQALEEIARFDICRRHGIIVAESAADKVLPPLSAPYAVHREYRYGKIKLTVYHRNED